MCGREDDNSEDMGQDEAREVANLNWEEVKVEENETSNQNEVEIEEDETLVRKEVEVEEDETSGDSSSDDDIIELEAKQSEREAVAQRYKVRVQEETEEVQQLRGFLDSVRGTCPYCRWQLKKQRDHVLYRCREAEAFDARNRYKILQGMIRKMRPIVKYSGRTECFVPIEWCNRFEGKRTGSQGGAKEEWIKREGKGLYQFDEMVLGEYVVAVENDAEFAPVIQQRMSALGFEWEQDEDRVRYFGGREEWGIIEANQLLRELSRFIQAFRVR